MPLLLAAALAAATPAAAPDFGQVLDWCRRDFAVKAAGGPSILGTLLDAAKVAPEHRGPIAFICAVREDGAIQALQLATRPKVKS